MFRLPFGSVRNVRGTKGTIQKSIRNDNTPRWRTHAYRVLHSRQPAPGAARRDIFRTRLDLYNTIPRERRTLPSVRRRGIFRVLFVRVLYTRRGEGNRHSRLIQFTASASVVVRVR